VRDMDTSVLCLGVREIEVRKGLLKIGMDSDSIEERKARKKLNLSKQRSF
jgi:hypothetical protein